MQLLNDITASLVAWRRKLATGGVGLLALMLAYHVICGQNGWIAYHEKKVEYQRLQAEVDQIQAENQSVSHNIKALKTDPKAIEKEAREQLRYVRPDEVVVDIPEAKAKPNTSTAQAR
jgi:cell division protein FtsB